jgi:DNA repair protein RecN (Recombination protein N)
MAADAQKAKQHLGACKKGLEELQEARHSGQKERDLAAYELEELAEAALKEGEEEALSAEHRRLAHVQEIAAKLGALCSLLDDPPHAVIANLKRSHPLLKSACSIDPALEEAGQLLSQGIVNLEEVRHMLQTYLGRLENDPQRLSFLEERLSLYHKFRRKYGDPFSHQSALSEKLNRLDHLEERIASAAQAVDEAKTTLSALRQKLTKERQKAANKLSVLITEILRTLHMPHAEVSITITGREDSEDNVEFYLHANRGEKKALVKEHASGGELSRLMLALQTALAQHHAIPVLVFDEVDANVGGQTASAIAEKLATIADHRQVLCVTHFPQVAKRCHHHVRIFKKESKDRTVTHLEALDPSGREIELNRMSG